MKQNKKSFDLKLPKKINNRKKFRDWLIKYGSKSNEIYLLLKRGKPIDKNTFYYLDAVEEALCFGYIDSTLTRINGVAYQRFSKRKKNSHWTQLNIARVKRLIKLGLMNKEGIKVLPDNYDKDYKFDKSIINILKKNNVYNTFKKFPLLYQKIRVDNLLFYRDLNKSQYKASLDHLIKETKKGKMFGEWSDYGRLLEK